MPFRASDSSLALEEAMERAAMTKLEEVCTARRIQPQVLWLPYNKRGKAKVHATLLETGAGDTKPHYETVALELLQAVNAARKETRLACKKMHHDAVRRQRKHRDRQAGAGRRGGSR